MVDSTVNQTGSAGEKRKQPTEVPTDTTNTAMPKQKKQYVSRSDAWKYFTKSKDDPEKVSCNHCPSILKYKPKSGTSVLWTHHNACKGFKAFAESNTQKTLVKSSEDGQLVSVIFDQNACRQVTAKMIVLDELPFATVERPGFIHFCEVAVPKFEIPSRSTITRDVVKMYMKEKVFLRSLFSKNKQRLCLTTDLWTASTTSISYMVITAHFIDENWCLQRKIISFKPVPDHKGETIADRLKSCMIEWGIEKIFTVTVDNASSNDNAIRHFKEKIKYMSRRDDALILGGDFMHVRCCAHILNLIVRDGLEEINSSVNAIRNAVKYLRSSDHRFLSFQMRLGMSRNVSRGSLVLDCTTRWNSTYLMLEAALRFRSTFEIMANEDRPYNSYFLEMENKKKRDGPPLDEDWNKASRLKIFLEVFYDSTLAFSAFKTVTSSSCYDEICSIEASLLSLSNDQDPKVRDMASPMREKFDKYWDGLDNINPMLIVASVFDPRSKMAFPTICFENMYGKNSSTSIEMKKKVMNLLRKLFEAYTVSQGRNMDKSKQSESEQADCLVTNMKTGGSSSSHRRRATIFSTLYKQRQSENQCSDSANELTIYLMEKVEVESENGLGLQYDILSWWRDNSVKFPVLSEIAKDVLAIPVSTVSSESAFSTAGRILDPYRSSLSPPMVETLILTQNWIKTAAFSDKQKSMEQMLQEHEFMDSLVEEFRVQSEEA